MYRKLLLLASMLPAILSAQNSYNNVYSILNTKCSNATCHSAASSEALKFDGTSAAVYAAIIDQPPTNAGALSRGERIVWPDQPYQSTLLKRAGGWFDTDLSLPQAETDAAHTNAGLTNKEVEYIRQWIMNDAKQTSLSIDTAVINAYYNDPGRAAFFPKLAPPAAGAGKQVRYGPIFVKGTAGNNEIELMLMNQVSFPADMEITGVEGSMSSESHHFLLFKFDDSASAMAKATGLRQVSLSNFVTPFDGNKTMVGAWQTPENIMLPRGTAFFWPQTTYLDLDYHVKNYNAPGTSGIEPFDFYLNISARPKPVNTTTIEMKSKLVNNPGFSLLPNQVTSWDYPDDENGINETRYLWLMSSHTHKFGTGFDIFVYDTAHANTSHIGDTLYVGTYDYVNGQDMGTYQWEHPSVEYFSPQRPIDMSAGGLICRTVWDNTSGSLIQFGFTTAAEMQLFYYMYTTELPAANGIGEVAKHPFDFMVYPNPMTGSGTIAYKLDAAATVTASISDITGKEIAMMKDEQQEAGKYNIEVGKAQQIPAGMYFARVNVNGETFIRKFTVE